MWGCVNHIGVGSNVVRPLQLGNARASMCRTDGSVAPALFVCRGHTPVRARKSHQEKPQRVPPKGAGGKSCKNDGSRGAFFPAVISIL